MWILPRGWFRFWTCWKNMAEHWKLSLAEMQARYWNKTIPTSRSPRNTPPLISKLVLHVNRFQLGEYPPNNWPLSKEALFLRRQRAVQEKFAGGEPGTPPIDMEATGVKNGMSEPKAVARLAKGRVQTMCTDTKRQLESKWLQAWFRATELK